MIILICGFTASGKSYVSEKLAKKLNYRFIHTSHVLKQIANNKEKSFLNTKMNKGWYEKSNLDKVRFKDDFIDSALDKYLLSIVKSEDNLVLDSWTLPYLFKRKKDVVRIWLTASKKERINRMSKRDKISVELTKKLINQKDNFNKTHFKKLYGFSLGKDLDVFDYVLDTTKLDINGVLKSCLNYIKSSKYYKV